jgi:hypothetical protein
LNGDGDSASREYTAASSYYKEAASIYPSSGNPHHQVLPHYYICSLDYLFSIPTLLIIADAISSLLY